MVIGDIVDKRTCQEIIDSTIERFSSIDVLVNNAGRYANSGFMDTSEEFLDEMINLNFKSVFTLTQLAVPHLIKTKGTYSWIFSGIMTIRY